MSAMRLELPRTAAGRLLALLIAVAPAVAGVLPGAAVTSAAGVRAKSAAAIPLMGVNVSNVDIASPSGADADINAAAALGATVVRTELEWSIMQPRGPSSYDPRAIAYADRLVADASAHHIRVILLVDSAPCWESSAPPAVLKRCAATNSRANGYPPRSPADYADFVAFLARRYGAALAAIEVWNEPDHINEHFFAGPEKARHYAELVRAAYQAIKHADPAVAVIAGSLVGSNGVFLRALYAHGMKGYYDGLAVHYYTLTLASVRSIRKVQLASGDATPLWLDEFGWSSCWPRERVQAEQACVTDSVQAVNLRDVLRVLAHTSYIAAEVPYKLRDSAREEFGVVAASGAHKPAFSAVASALASPFGPVSRTRLKLHLHSGAILATGSGPVGDIMQLEASAGNGLVYRASFTLDRFDRFSLALPRVVGRHGVRVRVWQVWAGRGAGALASI
jgi:cellulase (glycosyl hydrolase family 5)